MTDGSDYLLLHLMDGVDAIEIGHHEPGTCFRLQLQKFDAVNADNVSGLRATTDKIFLNPPQRLVNEECFSWNIKTRLSLGSASANSFLRVSILKGSRNDGTFGRDENFGKSHSKQVYAETVISVEALRLGQDLQDHANSASEISADQFTTRRYQQQVEHQLALKILPEVIEHNEFTSQHHVGEKSTASVFVKDSQPMSSESRVRAAEDAYNAELSKLLSFADPLQKESSSVQDPRTGYFQSPSSRGAVRITESKRFFRIRFGYILIIASRAHIDLSASSPTSIGDAADLAEVTRKFFGVDSTRVDLDDFAPRRSFEVVEYSMSLATEPFTSKRSTTSSPQASATHKVSNKSGGYIYDELHSMCSSSKFLAGPKSIGASTGGDAVRQSSSQLGGMFLGKEGEIPSRTFIELLRLRVSPVWAERVQGLMSELSGACTPGGLHAGAAIGVDIDSVVESDGKGKGSLEGVNRYDLSSHSRHSICAPSYVNDAETIRTLKILRDSAQVRVVGMSESGVVSAQLRDGA